MMVQVINKAQESIREEMRKLQSEVTKIKRVLFNIKTSIEALSWRITAADEKIGKLQDEKMQDSVENKTNIYMRNYGLISRRII